jgi:transposase InsO family protein
MALRRVRNARNCYDNAMVESVFKTIKSELIWRTSFQSRPQADRGQECHGPAAVVKAA